MLLAYLYFDEGLLLKYCFRSVTQRIFRKFEASDNYTLACSNKIRIIC